MKRFIYTFMIIFIYCSSSNALTLRWDANTESDLEGYKIYYGYSSGIYAGAGLDQGDSPITIPILDLNDPNYMQNIDPEFVLSGENLDGHDYYLVVTAYDVDNNESGYSNEVNTIGFGMPTIPQNLSATITSATSVSLTWDISTDNGEILEYYVYRDGSIIDSVVTNSYYDNTLTPGVVYSYTVTAIDNIGNESGHSNMVSAMTNDNSPPSTPQNLEALTISSTSIELEWEKSIDSVGVVGYDVYRDFVVVSSIVGEISDFISYTDIGLAPSTLYTYSIIAWDAANNRSNHSILLSVTTLLNNNPSSSGGGDGGCFINTLKGV